MDKIGTLEASKLVIRSSSKSEDQNNESNAGKYESILNVDINHIEIRSAIEMVFASYDDINDSDHLIIQRMTTNSDTSGVVFTRELNTNNPYYIINYSKGNDTSTITSGKDGSTDLIYRFAIIPDRWRTLIDAVKEIEDIFESKPLDIEFSLQNGVAIIHQVRPMVFSSRTDISYDSIIRLHLTMIEKYNEISDKGSWILSDMAFWNPAEIIGINPKPLAYSLYSKIITDKSWNTGISEIGYSKVDNILMHQLGNKPLIDVISSFEALTPATIGIEIRNKLIDYYIDKISNEPYLHDKIEFNLVFNCLNFNSMEMLANLPIDILSDPEKEALYCSLKKFTFTIINDFDKWVSIDDEIKNEILNDLDSLEIEYKNSDVFYLSHLILDFVDKIKNSIAVAFSREARYAFIAKNIVDSMEGKNDISSTELSDFYESLRSITRDYRAYSNKVKTNEISYDDFLNFYGHLRSGTYDITTMPYSELDRVSVISDNQTPFVYSNLEEATVSDKVINSLITNISILFGGIDENKVRNFIYDAIPRREEFKFYYSKALSFVIEMIAFLGEKLSFNREEMQYLSLDDISMFNRFNSNIEFRSYLNMILNGRRDIYKQNLYILVPDIVFSENDLSFFSLLNSKPNFVNREVVSGNVAHLNSMSNLNIDNKIIVIENADPGFDWIFNHNIIGLITKYGGVASHMAIRCSELRIPAAIGVGLKLFNTIKDDSIVTIDGLNQRLEVK